jgi:hypothetical protein
MYDEKIRKIRKIHYSKLQTNQNNQTAAAVDYNMFNFDNFSIIYFVWTGFIKENSHVWSKKVKLLF